MASDRPVEFSASIRLFGADLDFEAISDLLTLSPSWLHRAGDQGRFGPYQQDLWSLKSPLPRADALDAHLRWLKQKLEPHYGFLLSLKGVKRADFFCGVVADGEECRFQLSAEALPVIVELGIEMELSLIFLGDPDDATEQEPTAAEGPTDHGGDLADHHTESRVSLQTAVVHSPANDAFFASLGLLSAHLTDPGFGSPATHATHQVRTFSTPLPSRQGLDAHLKWLSNVLVPRSEEVRSILARSEAVIRCEFGTDTDNGGVAISADSLRAPTACGIPVDFHTFLI